MDAIDTETDDTSVDMEHQGFRSASARPTYSKQNVECKTYARRYGDKFTQSTHSSKHLFDPGAKYTMVPNGRPARTKASVSGAKRLYDPNPKYPGTPDGHHSWTKASARTTLNPMPDLEPEPTMIPQPEMCPISHEQLVVEVKGIYAGLVMVEAKCIEAENTQTVAARELASTPGTELTQEQWQALIALHKSLLHEHHDFFLASQHPSASPALSRLAAKYSMPARMWRHGFRSFLEVLRRKHPLDLDYMLAFLYVAYSTMALLYETAHSFEETWTECLGELAWYRIAIEEHEVQDREIWSGVARTWYYKAVDKSLQTGRLHHHLAILAGPLTLQQLLLHAHSLTRVTPFENDCDSVTTPFKPIKLTPLSRLISWPTQFFTRKGHGALFSEDSATCEDFNAPTQLESDASSFESLPVITAFARPQLSSRRGSTAVVSNDHSGSNTERCYEEAESVKCMHTGITRLLRGIEWQFRGLIEKLGLFSILQLVGATSPEIPSHQNPSPTAIAPLGSFVSSHLEMVFPASCFLFVPLSLVVASRYSRPHVYGCLMGVSSIVLLTTADNTSMSALVSTT